MRPYAELPEQNLVFIPLYFAFSATGGKAELTQEIPEKGNRIKP